ATWTTWRLSTIPERTTVTVMSAYRTGDARAAGTGGLRPRPARPALRRADRRGARRALRHRQDDRPAHDRADGTAVRRRPPPGQAAAVRDGGRRAGADAAPAVGRPPVGGAL